MIITSATPLFLIFPKAAILFIIFILLFFLFHKTRAKLLKRNEMSKFPREKSLIL